MTATRRGRTAGTGRRHSRAATNRPTASPPSPAPATSSIGRGLEGRLGLRRTAVVGAVVALSAAANSAAVANRSAGNFSSAVSTAASTAGGTLRRSSQGGRGSSVSTLETIACGVGPVNGGSPSSIS